MLARALLRRRLRLCYRRARSAVMRTNPVSARQWLREAQRARTKAESQRHRLSHADLRGERTEASQCRVVRGEGRHPHRRLRQRRLHRHPDRRLLHRLHLRPRRPLNLSRRARCPRDRPPHVRTPRPRPLPYVPHPHPLPHVQYPHPKVRLRLPLLPASRIPVDPRLSRVPRPHLSPPHRRRPRTSPRRVDTEAAVPQHPARATPRGPPVLQL